MNSKVKTSNSSAGLMTFFSLLSIENIIESSGLENLEEQTSYAQDLKGTDKRKLKGAHEVLSKNFTLNYCNGRSF